MWYHRWEESSMKILREQEWKTDRVATAAAATVALGVGIGRPVVATDVNVVSAACWQLLLPACCCLFDSLAFCWLFWFSAQRALALSLSLSHSLVLFFASEYAWIRLVNICWDYATNAHEQRQAAGRGTDRQRRRPSRPTTGKRNEPTIQLRAPQPATPILIFMLRIFDCLFCPVGRRTATPTTLLLLLLLERTAYGLSLLS